MWQATLALALLVAAAVGADPLIPACLPQKTTVVSVSVRAGGSHYCTNTTQNMQLISQLLDQVQQGPVDKRCQLGAPRLQECTPVGEGQTNMRTRMTITASMTCDSPCVSHNSTLQSLIVLKDNLIYLRSAAQQRLSVDLNIRGVDILMWFFDGRQSIVSSCQSNITSSVPKGILLCDCPVQCDKCEGGYYLPPMSSECQPCPKGTWRSAGLDYSSCVQCPPTTSTSSFGASSPTDCIAPVCSQGKVYSQCGPVCPPTCTNPTPPSDCPSDCVSGCFCPSNMVDYNGRCVLPSICSSFSPPPPRPPIIIDTNIISGNLPLTIGYDVRVFQGVNITIDCSPLVQQHPEGNIHWFSQLINPRAEIRDQTEIPLPDASVELVVPSTSIPDFLQVSFRCEVCLLSQCWSNNSIISVVTIPQPPPPTLPPPTLPPLSCPPGKFYKECGSPCPLSCNSTELECPSVCVDGCFCPDGLLEDDGACVRSEDCSQSGSSIQNAISQPPPATFPPTNLPSLSCPTGMIYKECGSPCPPSCVDADLECSSVCLAGCFCPDGLLEDDGKCVRPEDCSQSSTSNQPAIPPPPTPPPTLPVPSTPPPSTFPSMSCPPGTIYKECGSLCPPSCAMTDLECPSVCVTGCFCPDGQLEDNGQCVRPEDCSQSSNSNQPDSLSPPPPPSTFPSMSCPPGTIYNECGSLCPPSCAMTDLQCPSVCVAGCFCPDGQLEDNGQCVHPEDCSQSISLDQRDVCQLSQDPGPCSNMVVMFSYNPATFQCDPFEYGGCEGNDNRFASEQACMDTCYSN